MTPSIDFSTTTENACFSDASPEPVSSKTNARFEIHLLEWPEQNLGNDIISTRSDRYEILWVTKGNGTIKLYSATHQIVSNTIYCLAPGQLRQIESNYGIEGFYIAFAADFLDIAQTFPASAFRNTQIGVDANLPVIHVDSEMSIEIADVVRKMTKEYSNYFLLRSEILKWLLKILLIYISRKSCTISDETIKNNNVEIAEKFMASLKKQFVTKKMVSDYAKDLCLTPNYLNQIVKKVTGFTASHHIQQQIMLEAKRQALYSGLSMKEVAYALGFNDCMHFSRFFKTNSGVNFTSFKKSKGEFID